MIKYFFIVALGWCSLSSPVQAATTFLPDWQQTGLNFEGNEGNFNRDEPLCIEAVDQYGNKLYHKADSCPKPKIFDEYCAHDDRYISKCYCPAHCSSSFINIFPYRMATSSRVHLNQKAM